VAGEIQALYTPRIPGPFAAADPRVKRLWPNVAAEERAYFARTGIFPIMHVVVIRREVYEAQPWVAQSLYKAFVKAKRCADVDLYDSSALRVMSPWLNQDIEEAHQLLGDDYWPYGLGEVDRNVLATFLRYHHEQALSPNLLQPEDLFAPESLESAVI
jgi:4,5-dihydroxyphthalate decarboxylase